ncbi:MAG: FmdE family protein [Anaerolineales bacterium]
MSDLKALLAKSAARHNHICPRQVLGVRIGLAGSAALGIHLPNPAKRLLTIIETDGCFADGIEVSTGCTIGHRTLRVEDYGKVAATFIDTSLGRAIRLFPKPEIRQQAKSYCPEEPRRYFYQLQGYEVMPDEELFQIQDVELTTPLDVILSRPGARASCEVCGEEIVNEREVERHGKVLCHACIGQAYYRVLSQTDNIELQDPVWVNLAS